MKWSNAGITFAVRCTRALQMLVLEVVTVEV